MATDPTTIPSVVDLQKTKKSMTDIDTFVDSGNNNFTDNNGQTRKTLKGVESDANALAKNFNLTDAGFDFATGGTIETYNQLVKDASGNSWQWQGSLPHAVVAGTVPSNPDWQQRTFNEIANISGLRDELDSSELRLQDVERTCRGVWTFGALGLGDDTAALQEALDWACKNNGKLTFGDSSTKFGISEPLYIRADADIIIEGANSQIYKLTDWTGSWLWCERFVKDTTTITTQDLVKGRRFIPTDSAQERDKFEKGDLFTLSSDQLWYYDNRNSLYKGETHVVDQPSAITNSILLENVLFDTYDSAGTEVVTLTIHRRNKLVMRDLHFSCNRGVSSGLGLNNLVDSYIENVTVDNGLNANIILTNCYNTTLSKVVSKNAIAFATGYGVQINASTNCRVTDSQFFGNRRAVDISGVTPSRACLIDHNFCNGAGLDENGDDMYTLGNSSGFGSHSTADANVYENNVVTNVYYAFISRGQRELFQNNLVYGKCYGYFASVDGGSVTVKNNTYLSGNDNGIANWEDCLSVFAVVYDRPTRGKVTIKSNSVDFLEDGFLILKDVETRGYCEYYDIIDNNVDFFGVAGGGDNTWVYFIRDNDANGIEMRSSKVLRNNTGVVRADGGYNKFYEITMALTDPVNSCMVDDYPLTLTISNGGTGNAALTTSEVLVSTSTDTVSISGYIEVDVTGTIDTLVLEGFPRQQSGRELQFSLSNYGSADPVYLMYTGFTSSYNKFFVTSNPAATTSALTEGNYRFAVDFKYNTTLDVPW